MSDTPEQFGIETKQGYERAVCVVLGTGYDTTDPTNPETTHPYLLAMAELLIHHSGQITGPRFSTVEPLFRQSVRDMLTSETPIRFPVGADNSLAFRAIVEQLHDLTQAFLFNDPYLRTQLQKRIDTAQRDSVPIVGEKGNQIASLEYLLRVSASQLLTIFLEECKFGEKSITPNTWGTTPLGDSANF